VRPGVPPAIGTPVTGRIVAAPVGGTTLASVQAARVVRTESPGRQVITEPGNRTIIRQNNTVIVHRNETTTINNFYPSARSVPRPNGVTETFYVRPDGVRIFSETDRNGRLIRRWGRPQNGPEIVYVDNRKFYRNLAIGVGIGVVALAIAAPVIAMPRERYIVEYESASDDDIYTTLVAPPVKRLERAYSLEEVRYSRPLRDHMPRVDLDTITFDTGSFVVSEDQYPKLERIARGMAKAIEQNPSEMFLIEGHTDATGSTEDNVSLSDRRAEAIQRVLFEYYQIPLENLTPQGYGEQYLKVQTQGPERSNRRVSIRRITPLLGGKE
jgi:outer membrane protein OmpA-like peptidoglycan-associated protein